MINKSDGDIRCQASIETERMLHELEQNFSHW